MPRGKLTDLQIKFTELVAQGRTEMEALAESGYDITAKHQIIRTLRNNKRVQERILMLKGSVDKAEVATREDREAFWTKMMNDPKNSGSNRLEASKLLGKAKGDFIDRSQIDANVKTTPVLIIPDISPTSWEKFFEENR